MSRPQLGPKAPSSAPAYRSRNNSDSATPQPSTTSKASSNRQPDAVQSAIPKERNVHYTLIVRLPFARRDFEDPPPVSWNADKDRKLWRTIANTPKIGDLNWEEIAKEFGVDLNFILQQAAWLYQRHMDNVREQMKKVGASMAGGSGAPTPVLGQHPGAGGMVGGYPMKRLGSGGSSRTPSSLSIRPRESPTPMGRGGESSAPGTPITAAPPLSRSPSSATVTQSKFAPPSPRQPVQRSFRTSNPPAPSKLGIAVETGSPGVRSPDALTAKSSPALSNSSSSSSDADDAPTRRSRIFARRPQPRFQSYKKSTLGHGLGDDSDGDSDEDSPIFATTTGKSRPSNSLGTRREPETNHRDRSSTLKKSPDEIRLQPLAPSDRTEDELSTTSSTSPSKPPLPGPTAQEKGKSKAPLSSSASSAASSAPQPSPVAHRHSLSNPSNQASSPSPHRSSNHRTELARLQSPTGLSPIRSRPTGGAAGGGPASDGTPSMGSSFSDLDDTSITQSALEEALASNLRHGAASRLSNFGTLGNAFRSRYT